MKPERQSKIKTVFWSTAFMMVGITVAWGVLSLVDNIDYGRIFQNSSRLAEVTQAQVSQSKVEANKPAYFYLNKNAEDNLKVSALSYLVGDLNTGEVIISKNQDITRPIASISKLMTALVVDEILPPKKAEIETTKITKSALATYGTNGGLRRDENIKVYDLLYPLLLESSNDAAEALAEHFDRESFMAKMNLKAETLLMSGTSYEDPSGLSAANQSTTSDIFKLVGYINKESKDLLEVTTMRSFSNKKHSWSNINPLAKRRNFLGGKTGYTDAAKQTLVTLFSLPLGEVGERPIAIVLLGSQDRLQDTESILKYLEKNIYYGGESDANTAWVLEKVGLPSIKDPDFITLSFLGDIMLDRGVRNSVTKNFGGDYSMLFENPDLNKILEDSDIVFGNLEGTASDRGADLGNLYSFRMNPSVVPALSGAGINVLSVANNHIGDWGPEAYSDTLARLRENEILYTGGGIDRAEAEKPAIIEKYGMKIGFLGFSDKGPNFMRASAENAGILLASDPRFEEIVQNASEQVDALVVSFHFGEEYQPLHDGRQESLAHSAVDNGAKIVIGHHPHVIQDTEVYKDAFIAYSLGNFIFDQSWSEPTMRGMLLNIKLKRNGNMTVRSDEVKLNSAFQPDKIRKGVEEKLEFPKVATQ